MALMVLWTALIILSADTDTAKRVLMIPRTGTYSWRPGTDHPNQGADNRKPVQVLMVGILLGMLRVRRILVRVRAVHLLVVPVAHSVEVDEIVPILRISGFGYRI